MVVRVIPISEANNILVHARDFNEDEPVYNFESIVNIWARCVYDYNWLYSQETDYFIECSIPEYDNNNIWFARKTDGGWFSMDIQSGWQAGVLDVDSELYKYMKEKIGLDDDKQSNI